MVIRFGNITCEEKNEVYAFAAQYSDYCLAVEVENAFGGEEAFELLLHAAKEVLIPLLKKLIEKWTPAEKGIKTTSNDFEEIEISIQRPDGTVLNMWLKNSTKETANAILNEFMKCGDRI